MFIAFRVAFSQMARLHFKRTCKIIFICICLVHLVKHLQFAKSFTKPIPKKKVLFSEVKENFGLKKLFFGNTWTTLSPTIYAITPTYARLTQKADLTRLIHTLLHVHNLHWIVVEDSIEKTTLVANMLNNSGLSYTHLNVPTDEEKRKAKRERYHGIAPKGIEQRNVALSWMRENIPQHKDGVLYFMDDDNTYTLKLFEEMRATKLVSSWLVGFAGGMEFEGPGKCEGERVLSWYAVWGMRREFPIDMAGFAVNLNLIFQYPNVLFSYQWRIGYLENNFLKYLHLKTRDMEGKGGCMEVLAWHTRTQKPPIKLRKHFKDLTPSKDNVEV